MILLDANVWIAFLYKDDALHKKAEKLFELDGKIIGIPEYVIIEVSSVLSRKAGKETANNFLEMVTQSKDVEVLFADDQFFIETIDFFKKARIKIYPLLIIRFYTCQNYMKSLRLIKIYSVR